MLYSYTQQNWLRGTDLHRRSLGYEPSELLLLHPAIKLFMYGYLQNALHPPAVIVAHQKFRQVAPTSLFITHAFHPRPGRDRSRIANASSVRLRLSPEQIHHPHYWGQALARTTRTCHVLHPLGQSSRRHSACFGATGRNRTGTRNSRQILSLLRLPITPQSRVWWR